MKVGQDLAQQLNALPDDQVAENAQALLDGLKSSVVSVLFNALLQRMKDWISDPEMQKKIGEWILAAIQNLFKKP